MRHSIFKILHALRLLNGHITTVLAVACLRNMNVLAVVPVTLTRNLDVLSATFSERRHICPAS